MTILATGTVYYEVRCTVHGIVYEDTDAAAADDTLRRHLAECGGASRIRRTVGKQPWEKQPWDTPVRPAVEAIIQGGGEPPPTKAYVNFVAAHVTEALTPKVRNLSPQATLLPGTFSPTGWTPPEKGLSIESWLAMGQTLQLFRNSLHFIIGDWLNYGEAAYGEMYSQALDQTGWAYQTLNDIAWVARAVPISLRKEELSWNQHKAVAGLPVEAQQTWLGRAQSEGLSSAALRQGIAAEKGVAPPETCICDKCGREHRKG